MESRLTHAKQDIISATTRRLYAKQGDVLEVITCTGDVWILQAANGDRFPSHISRLSDEPVGVSAKIEQLKEKIPKQSNKPLTQAEKIQLEYLNSLKK